MDKEYLILIMMWILGLLSLYLIPKKKFPIAIFALLSCQALTWLNCLIHVKYQLIAFPVREFPKATDVLLTTDFLIYPLICALCYILEPKGKWFIRFSSFVFWISILTIIDFLLEKYTDLIEYVHYNAIWTWINFFLIFMIMRFCTRWFFKDIRLFQADWRATR